MVVIDQIKTPIDLIPFFVWVLVVCAVAKFLFGSLPAAEILYRISQKPKMQGLRKVITYLLVCFSCQAFWAALIVFAIMNDIVDYKQWIFTACAYSGAATLLSRFKQNNLGLKRTGCGSCGGKS